MRMDLVTVNFSVNAGDAVVLLTVVKKLTLLTDDDGDGVYTSS